MSQIVDNLIAFRVLRLLTMNFSETTAFKLGIIDENGNSLKSLKDLRTQEEKDSYSMLHRMVFRLKKLLAKLPGGENKISSFAAAYWLVKESLENGKENKTIEQDFYDMQQSGVVCVEEYVLVSKFLNEELSEEVPVNNTAGASVREPAIKPRSKWGKKKLKDVVV